MLKLAVGLFAVAAMVGVYMLRRLLAGRMPPWLLSGTHFIFAGAALVVLFNAFVTSRIGGTALLGFLILVLATAGGILLGAFHVTRRVAPKRIASVHAGAAILGLFVLAGSAFGLI
jgi:hypothetical protein